MDADASLFLTVNGFVRSTPRLHGPLTLYAEYSPVLFTGLLITDWWIARRDDDPVRVAAAVWPPLGTLLHQVLLRLVVAVQGTRPWPLPAAQPANA